MSTIKKGIVIVSGILSMILFIAMMVVRGNEQKIQMAAWAKLASDINAVPVPSLAPRRIPKTTSGGASPPVVPRGTRKLTPASMATPGSLIGTTLRPEMD